MRKLEVINQVRGKRITSLAVEDGGVYIGFDGMRLRLEDTGQQCCEHRYMHTDDEIEQFVGSVFTDVVMKDVSYEEDEAYGDVTEIQLMENVTDKGSLVVCAYNEHNGYYSGFYIEAFLE